jgi:phenol hydroxylase P3 protein
MTRGLDWEPTYQKMDDIFPYIAYEGIKIHDWDKWEDPFRLTMDAYWKYQAEKERKLYAIIDAFARTTAISTSPTRATSTALKLFLRAISPLEYVAHRGFAHVPAAPSPGVGTARGLPDAVARRDPPRPDADPCDVELQQVLQRLPRLRHMHDRVWYLSVPRRSSTTRSPPGRSSS